jgi:hypothetical protein
MTKKQLIETLSAELYVPSTDQKWKFFRERILPIIAVIGVAAAVCNLIHNLM